MFLLNNLKAIAIMGVAYGHMSGYDTSIGRFCAKYIMLILMPICMPLFSFCAGFFHSKEVKTSANHGSIFNLISFFFAGFLLLYPFRIGMLYETGKLTLDSALLSFVDLRAHSILWFILALIVWRIIAPIIIRVKFYMLLVIFLGLSSAFFGDSANVILGGLRYMPFYFLGIAISWEKIVSLRMSNYKYLSVLAVFLVLLFCVALKIVFKIELTPGSFHESSVFKYLLLGGIYYLLSFSALLFLFSFMWGRRIKIFTQIGTNSMSVYIFHMYICTLFASLCIYPLLQKFNCPMILVCLVQVLVFALTCYISSLNSLTKLISRISDTFHKIIFNK